MAAPNPDPQQPNKNQSASQNTGQNLDQNAGQSTSRNASQNTAQNTGRSATQNMAQNRGSQADQERTIDTTRDRDAGMRGAIRRAQTQGVRGGFAPFLPSPFSLMRRMAEDMDRVLQDLTLGRNAASQNTSVASPFERDQWSGTSAATQTAWIPPVEIFKRDDKIVIRAELPGLKKEDVKVEVDNGMLVLSGERCDENEDSRDGFYRSERVYGQFYRAIPLPEGVDADHCEASFKDGVLEVTFPAPKSQERKTQVNIR